MNSPIKPHIPLSQEALDTLRKMVYDGIQYHITAGYSNCFTVDLFQSSPFLLVQLGYIQPPYSKYEVKALGMVKSNVNTFGKLSIENNLVTWMLSEILVTDRYNIREAFIDAGLGNVIVTLNESEDTITTNNSKEHDHILSLITKHTTNSFIDTDHD